MAEAVHIELTERQKAFLSSTADIAIYGGGAGGGKTYSLLMEPIYHLANPNFGAVIFRRTSPRITNEGGIWDQSCKLYPQLGGKPFLSEPRCWLFPSGAKVHFSHLQHEVTKFDWHSSEICLLEFDELTEFTEGQFWYMLSRNRSMCGVKPYVRAGCNPDVDSWVAKLISWWIDPDSGLPIYERSGVLRWFVRVNDVLHWADHAEQLREMFPDLHPKSLTFVPAKLADNKFLMEKDPGYLANLQALPMVEQLRLLGCNWKVRAAAGKVFNRDWFDVLDSPAMIPPGVECRFWDFAATEKTKANKDPDYTASILMRKAQGRYFVLDALAVREGPAEVERLFMEISRREAAEAKVYSRHYMVRWEEEPGSASKRDSLRLTQMLAGVDALGTPAVGSKGFRANPLAAQAFARNVKLLKGGWNEMWLTHMHHQPDLPHDDVMDASSGAFNCLAGYAGSLAIGLPPKGAGSCLDAAPPGMFRDNPTGGRGWGQW